MGYNGEKVIISGPSLYMPWITHMLFVDLNYNFSCKENKKNVHRRLMMLGFV